MFIIYVLHFSPLAWQRRKERYTHLNAEFQRIAKRDKKPSSVISAKKWRKTIEWERLEISSRKLEIPREHFMKMVTIKDRTVQKRYS